jgi:hypothetical protein
MHEHADEYLDLIAKHGCCILFQKAVPAGKLKRELIALADHNGRLLSLTTPRGFATCPYEIPRTIFDGYLAAQYIEQDGPEDPDGRILYALSHNGRMRVGVVRATGAMTIETYNDFD